MDKERDIIAEDEEWLASLDPDERDEMVGMLTDWMMQVEVTFWAAIVDQQHEMMRWHDDGGK